MAKVFWIGTNFTIHNTLYLHQHHIKLLSLDRLKGDTPFHAWVQLSFHIEFMEKYKKILFATFGRT